MFNPFWITNSLKSGQVSTKNNANNWPEPYTREHDSSSKLQQLLKAQYAVGKTHILPPAELYEILVVKRYYRIRRDDEDHLPFQLCFMLSVNLIPQWNLFTLPIQATLWSKIEYTKESMCYAEDSRITMQSSSQNAECAWKALHSNILKDCFSSLHSGQGQNRSRRWSRGASITNCWHLILWKVRYRPLVDDVVSQTKSWITFLKTVVAVRASEHVLVTCSSSIKKLRLRLDPGRILSREKPILLWHHSRESTPWRCTQTSKRLRQSKSKIAHLFETSSSTETYAPLELVIFGSNLSHWPCFQKIHASNYTARKTWEGLSTYRIACSTFLRNFQLETGTCSSLSSCVVWCMDQTVNSASLGIKQISNNFFDACWILDSLRTKPWPNGLVAESRSSARTSKSWSILGTRSSSSHRRISWTSTPDQKQVDWLVPARFSAGSNWSSNPAKKTAFQQHHLTSSTTVSTADSSRDIHLSICSRTGSSSRLRVIYTFS